MNAETDDLIDPRELAASYTPAELAAKADELVESMEDPTALLAKPVASLTEAPEILSCFGMLLGGLAPLPGMVVLDFGAGSCWTSHFLAQLGCRVIACDVSAAMLGLGERRFERQPLFGDVPEPEFLRFDGTKLALDDGSVDRIFCFDALHHVANVAHVISEMGRVLRPGGVAGFSEPGPHHSSHPQSQHEMRRYRVPEFDVVLDDVWASAKRSGFTELSVGIFDPAPEWVPLEVFGAFLRPVEGPASGLKRLSESGRFRLPATVRKALRLADELGRPATARASLSHVSRMRGVLANRRMFLMKKAGSEITDSRRVHGLAAEISLSDVRVSRGPATTAVDGVVRVRNTGSNRWLASSAGQGAVLLGLRTGHGEHPAADLGRVAIPGDSPIDPGGSARIPFHTDVPTPGPGEEPLRLELDLVSEGITWFANVQGPPHVVMIDPYD